MYYTKYFKNCYIRIPPGLQDYILLDFLEFMGFSNYYYILWECFERTVTCLYFTGLSLWDYNFTGFINFTGL